MSAATVQVGKLEALLARVQHNRGLPRPLGGGDGFSEDVPSLVPEPDSFAPDPAPVKAAPVPVPSPAVLKPPPRPAVEPAAPSPASSSRSPRTPLEIAVEDKLERPSVQPHVSAAQPHAHAPAPAAAAQPPAAVARASAQEPVMLADPAPPTASRAIGQVVSKAPPITGTTFGDLLRKSLSLRPR